VHVPLPDRGFAGVDPRTDHLDDDLAGRRNGHVDLDDVQNVKGSVLVVANSSGHVGTPYELELPVNRSSICHAMTF